jgi:hypothetical protein
MSSPTEIKQIIEEENPQALFLEPSFDEALIGTGRVCGFDHHVAVYDSSKCIEILINCYSVDEIEAYEHFYRTVILQEQGENKPIFINNFIHTKSPEEILNFDNFDEDLLTS